MKFDEMWKCPKPGCGYRELTALSNPSCCECGSRMVIITDEKERVQFDNELKKLFKRMVN